MEENNKCVLFNALGLLRLEAYLGIGVEIELLVCFILAYCIHFVQLFVFLLMFDLRPILVLRQAVQILKRYLVVEFGDASEPTLVDLR